MHERGEQRTVQQNIDWEIKAPLDGMVWLAGCDRSRNGWYGVSNQIGLARIGGSSDARVICNQAANQSSFLLTIGLPFCPTTA